MEKEKNERADKRREGGRETLVSLCARMIS